MPLVPGYDDATTLHEILSNLKLLLRGIEDGQQVTGLLSPRPGHPPSDGVDFTAETCEAVYRYLRRHGILCVRVLVAGHPDATGYSIIAANDLDGMRRLLDRGQKNVKRLSYTRRRLRMEVLDQPMLGAVH